MSVHFFVGTPRGTPPRPSGRLGGAPFNSNVRFLGIFAMLCFEILVNGKRKYTAGVADAEQLEARVETIGGSEEVVLSVTAFPASQRSYPYFANWGTISCAVGDEISVRLVDTNDPDIPKFSNYGVGTPVDVKGEALLCSFCGKEKGEVKTLVAGPKAYICDECVALCSDIVADET